jgi:two-component system, NtrC family, response regulator GlrR
VQGGWPALAVKWPDVAALDAAMASNPSGFVLLGEGADDVLVDRLAARPSATPLILIGEQNLPRANANAWLQRLPAPGVLNALLDQLLPKQSTPEARVWRRKSDMIIGNSPAISQVMAALDRFAPSSAPVLITGESGTGKELVARALHYSGPRSHRPFLTVNCAAIPETLFESELFGHARGAFTGAVTSRHGVFEAANGGTVFMDELGELPLSMQAKLLRVLESGEVTKLGSTEPKKIDVRLVTATNRDLGTEVKAGRFREDLYYRVRVCPVPLPPLRERPEDIAPLVFHHVTLISEREHRPEPRFSAAAIDKLLQCQWPGNVRELINVVQRALLMAEHGYIDAEHIELPENSQPAISSYSQARIAFETKYYTQLLRTTSGNISHASKLAKKTRKEIYDAMKRLGLDASRFRE